MTLSEQLEQAFAALEEERIFNEDGRLPPLAETKKPFFDGLTANFLAETMYHYNREYWLRFDDSIIQGTSPMKNPPGLLRSEGRND
jgi:hypothetical protein